jgi:hypothetical protein
MKLFVTTAATQGQSPDDFCWTEEDELAVFGLFHTVCNNPEGDCGCGRSMIGERTRRGTTTIRVADLNLTPDELERRIGDSYRTAGLTLSPEMLRRKCDDLVLSALPFDVGSILSRRGHVFTVRKELEREAGRLTGRVNWQNGFKVGGSDDC